MTQTYESHQVPHPAGVLATDSVVEFINVTAQFQARHGSGRRRRANVISAVDDVSFTVRCGTTFGLVGESGCGKSTVAGLIMGLVEPTAGRILVNGQDLHELTGADLSAHRRATQIVLQDPYSSLDPRMKVRHIIAEPLTTGRAKPSKQRLQERIDELLGQVGLPPNCADLYPHQFSGGQRQRIAIARALAPEPRLIVLDEPTSGLDVSVRAQVLNMLKDLQIRLGLTYVYISHDLASVAYMATTTAVMYLGRIVENGPSALLHDGSSTHPYTKLLLAAVPTWEKNNASVELATDDGDVPNSASIPSGCAFHPRCALRANLGNPAQCETERPEIREHKEQHWQACHFVAGGSTP